MSPAAQTTEFTAVAELDQLKDGTPHAAQLDGRAICLLRTGGEVIAFEDRCPHRGHPLSEGSCHDGVLRCALHGWEFGLPGGEAVSPRAPFGLELLETRISDSVVEVRP